MVSNISPNPLYKGDGDLKTTFINRDPRLIQTIFTPHFPLQIIGQDTTFFVRPAVNLASHLVCPTGYQINKILNFDPLKTQLPNGYGLYLGRDYLSPLSTQELTLNKSLVQNPGW